MISLDTGGAAAFLDSEQLASARDRAALGHRALLDGSGPGADALGWRRILLNPDDALLGDMERAAHGIREEADVFLSIGIGGSYLGAKAVIQALSPYFPGPHPGPEMLFAGTDMSGTYLRDLLRYLEDKSVFVNVISKSGTTLEPAIAFRAIRAWMESRFDDADRRITITTDPERGALNALRTTHDYRKYVIPRDVGGRFSVLTPVGLLPIAVAGLDIRSLFYGAVEALHALEADSSNPALEYAATRIALMEAGFDTEVLAVFEPCLNGIGGWWQQLFGESEGKSHSGLLPVSVRYSTDLHSLGQYVQDGKRNLLETFLLLDDDGGDLEVLHDAENLDGLNYLAGRTFTDVNRNAFEGTARAHAQGGVPVMTVRLADRTPTSLGQLLYFFEHAVGVGGHMMGINPFDQPGVEGYKKEMFALLGRP